MKKVYLKLIALSLTLVLSISMVVVASYAWLVMSGSPEVSGIQVTIGGGNTILVAADLTQTVDGVTYHYPDKFSDTLNFGNHESYTYLQYLAGLTPVSTADGINWFLPTYYDSTDKDVQEGKIAVGQLKDISEFTRENTLAHTNMTLAEAENILSLGNLFQADEDTVAEGSYVYLDFWVVSPGTDCTLRISVPTVAGDNSGGSFLVSLPEPVSDGGDGYTLANTESTAAAMFRVGFLANSDTIIDNTMVYYQQTAAYNENYRSLRGFYGEAGNTQQSFSSNRFTIYEPNADYHPENSALSGFYVPTNAIGLVNDEPTAVSVMDRVMVQKQSSWSAVATIDESGNAQSQPIIEQVFQTAILGKGLEQEELADYFYNTYLQGQVYAYVDKGEFIKKSANLDQNGAVSLDGIQTAGATDDVYIIALERNVPQRIRMFIWLEGQDVDCTNITEASSLVLNLEFAGSTTGSME